MHRATFLVVGLIFAITAEDICTKSDPDSSCSQLGKYTPEEHRELADKFNQDGFVILRNHFDKEIISQWYDNFLPLLTSHISYLNNTNTVPNRGKNRFYVTLPFKAPFNNPAIYEDYDIMSILPLIIGDNFVMCQLATDTPLFGSVYQDIHRDCKSLFPELIEFEDDRQSFVNIPSFQLALNFPLVNITVSKDNGPFEGIRGTHRMSIKRGMDLFEDEKNKEYTLERLYMNVGDVMIRDVRGLHRGTPNNYNPNGIRLKSNDDVTFTDCDELLTSGIVEDSARPMVVIGYSREWLNRNEVNIQIEKNDRETLSKLGKSMLRYNPIVEKIKLEETYNVFAFQDNGTSQDV